MQVDVEISYADLEGERRPVPGVVARCTRCDHTVESFGTSGRSIRRCLALLREECPMDEENFYVADDEGDD